MARPAILTLDDDADVLHAVERDLRSEYGAEYRVARAGTGEMALRFLEELHRRGAPSALFLVDQRMPGMSGVEFLERAIKIYPDAKRVLLTAYADTDAAIRAINSVQIDHYLLKPWDPPREKLYPVLNDLLDDWRASYTPPFEGIRVVGNPWAPACHVVKDFLARNNVPYLWLDPEISDEARLLMEMEDVSAIDLPCLFFPDGSALKRPDTRVIADRVGLKTTADNPFYDFVVVGGGPAGLAAAVYGASEGLRTLVVEEQAAGGQAGMSSRIENYLGFPSGVSGAELARRAVSQAKRFGVELLTAQKVVGLETDGPTRTIKLGDGTDVSGRAVLIASGVTYRQLAAEGIERLTGAGVYYGAAMSEGESVRDRNMFIVGGANSAGQAAMYFSQYAKSVTMLVRGESLSASMSQYLIDQIGSTENIETWFNAHVKMVLGDERLEQLVIARKGAEDMTVDAEALFIFIGAVPRTDWLPDTIARDDHGFIFSGSDAPRNGTATPVAPRPAERARARRHSAGWRPGSVPSDDYTPALLETSQPGVFVAGDVRHGSIKRVASAVGEGSMAVMYVHRYLNAL